MRTRPHGARSCKWSASGWISLWKMNGAVARRAHRLWRSVHPARWMVRPCGQGLMLASYRKPDPTSPKDIKIDIKKVAVDKILEKLKAEFGADEYALRPADSNGANAASLPH